MKKERIPRPVRKSEYITIYNPKSDIYRGVKTESFSPETKYEKWITNDFSVLKDGENWHIVGITHPCPNGFVDAFNNNGGVHEAEFQLFHATAKAKDFKELMKNDSFEDKEKILYSNERPNESQEIWAPHLLKRKDKFEIVYSPGSMRAVATKDFMDFEKPRELFKCQHPAARDPYIYEENGEYLFFWLDGDKIKVRTSKDFENWEKEKMVYTPPFKSACCESPFLMKRNEYYYLFWCIYDGLNGSYDNRTFVFAAKSIYEFEGKAPIQMLDAHAPEIVYDNGKYYILSVFYPQNGISAAEIEFE